MEVVDIACGADHVLALTSEGHVYVWGDNSQAQLARRTLHRPQDGLDPMRLGLRNIVAIGAGQYHSFAVDKDGLVHAWGLNSFHQLGVESGDELTVIRPQVIDSLRPANLGGARVVQVSGGEHHSLFLLDNGQVWGCGRTDANELGLAKDHPAQEGLKERRDEIKAENLQKVEDAKVHLEKVKANPKSTPEQIQTAEAEVSSAEAAVPLPPDDFVPEPVWVSKMTIAPR